MTVTSLSTHPRRDFERLNSASERFRFLLQYATIAPSSHNTQPWLWRIEGDEVELMPTARAKCPRSIPMAAS